MDKEGIIGIKTGLGLIIFMAPICWFIHMHRSAMGPIPAPPTPPTRMEAGKPAYQPGMEKPHKYAVMIKNDSEKFTNSVRVEVYAWTEKGAEEKALYIYGPKGAVEWVRKFDE